MKSMRFGGKSQFAASNIRSLKMPAEHGVILWMYTGFMALLLILAVDGQHTRLRRDILQLAKIMSCTTGKSFLQIIWRYHNYGCWCGLRGAGKPVDGTDWCCMKHDKCYERLNSKCRFFRSYLTSYSFQCISEQQVHCAAETQGGKCKYLLCKCDQQFANCISSQANYNSRYMYYNGCS